MSAKWLKERLSSIRLGEFGISVSKGFLPDRDPRESIIARISMAPALFEAVSMTEDITRAARKLLVTEHLREEFERMAVLWEQARIECGGHFHEVFARFNAPEKESLMRDLAFSQSAYIWGGWSDLQNNDVRTTIPTGFSHAICALAKSLDRDPMLAYASYVLNNWMRVHENHPIRIGNIILLRNFFGGLDEEGFILAHVEIEAAMGPVPFETINVLRAVVENDPAGVERSLLYITRCQGAMLAAARKMWKWCDKDIYFHRVRPHIQGSYENSAIPDGILFEGVPEFEGVRHRIPGETGAQSSIVPTLYRLLSVEHKKDDMYRYLMRMRMCMPKGHRAFVEFVDNCSENGAHLFSYVEKQKAAHPSLVDAYRLALGLLIEFLKLHREFAIEYVLAHKNKETTQNSASSGTGGTAYIPYLSEHIRNVEAVLARL